MNSPSATFPQASFQRASHTIQAMREVLAEHFGIVERELEFDRPLDSLGLDSLGFVEYVFEVEKVLKISLPDVPNDMTTVGELVLFIDREVSKQAGGHAMQGA